MSSKFVDFIFVVILLAVTYWTFKKSDYGPLFDSIARFIVLSKLKPIFDLSTFNLFSFSFFSSSSSFFGAIKEPGS